MLLIYTVSYFKLLINSVINYNLDITVLNFITRSLIMATVSSSTSIVSYDSLSAKLSVNKDFCLPAVDDRIGQILQTALSGAQKTKKSMETKEAAANFPTNMEKRFTLIHKAYSTIMKQRVFAITALVLGIAAMCTLILLMPVSPINLVFAAYGLLMISGIVVASSPVFLYMSVKSKTSLEGVKKKFDEDLQTLQKIIKEYGAEMENILPKLIGNATRSNITEAEISQAKKVLADWRLIMQEPVKA